MRGTCCTLMLCTPTATSPSQLILCNLLRLSRRLHTSGLALSCCRGADACRAIVGAWILTPGTWHTRVHEPSEGMSMQWKLYGAVALLIALGLTALVSVWPGRDPPPRTETLTVADAPQIL